MQINKFLNFYSVRFLSVILLIAVGLFWFHIPTARAAFTNDTFTGTNGTNLTAHLGLVIDGKLGPKTIVVIKRWQQDNGLVADGLVGSKTKARMNAIGG